MAGYATIGHVRIWYDEWGDGDPVVLLHPGGADARAWSPVIPALERRLRVFAPEQRAHGRTPDVEGPITYEAMTRDTVGFLEQVVGGRAHVAGYSAGATLALHIALERPDLVDRLALISGVFHRDGWIPEAIDPSLPPHPALQAGYAELSPDGADHYPVVHAKLARLNADEPTLDARALAAVKAPALVMTADDDEVLLEHAIATYRNLADAELAVVPGTTHGLLHEKPALCNAILLAFLEAAPRGTLAPVRRRAEAEH